MDFTNVFAATTKAEEESAIGLTQNAKTHPLTDYLHDRTVIVTSCGRIRLHRKKINLSKSLAGQAVGIREVESGIWLVSFMRYDLGYIDLEEKTLQPLENPFGALFLSSLKKNDIGAIDRRCLENFTASRDEIARHVCPRSRQTAPECVTYVSGTNCYPSVRLGQKEAGAAGGI